jgi:hypothetical protein
MSEDGQYGGNMKHVVIRLIKFVVVDVSTYVSLNSS